MTLISNRFKQKITIEQGVFILAILVAGLLRFVNLGKAGLSENEAVIALQSLALANGKETLLGGQPGIVALNTFLFFIFNSSNFLARFWPALFGTALVLVPRLYEKYIGKIPMLLMAFFIAVSPAMVAASKTVDGLTIALFGIAAGFGFYLNRKMILSGICFSFGLLGGVTFWPLVLTMGLALLLIPPTAEVNEQVKRNWVKWGLAALLTLVAIATQLFSHPVGITGIGSTLIEYLKSWTSTSNEILIPNFLLAIGFSQIPMILIGVWGLLNGLKQKSRTTEFLGLWWGFALLIILLNPSRSLLQLAWVSLPLYGLAVIQIYEIIKSLQSTSIFVLLAETTSTVTLIIFSALNFIHMINFAETDPILFRNRLIGTILPLALLVIITFLLAWGWNVESSRTGLFAGLTLLFICITLGNSWKAAGFSDKFENELWKNDQAVIGDSLTLKTLTDLSRWNHGQAYGIDIDVVGIESPSLFWELRNFEKVASDIGLSSNSTSSIVFTPETIDFQAQTSYRGQNVVWSSGPLINSFSISDWIKWFYFRNAPTETTHFLLWARNDLFKGSAQN
jgi:hypothetical protein